MKAFILWIKFGESVAKQVFSILTEKKINPEVKIALEPMEKIPRGYDIYFIHLKDLYDKSDLLNLKKEQLAVQQVAEDIMWGKN